MSIHAQLGKDFPVEHTFIQLQNINGTCFINSVLQTMFNLAPVQDLIEAWHAKLRDHNLFELAENSYTNITGHFVKIYIDSLRAPQNEVWYEPTHFLDRVFENGDFHRGEQNDANEFFLFLLKSIQRDTDFFSDLTNSPFGSIFSLFRFTYSTTIMTSIGNEANFFDSLECELYKTNERSILDCFNSWYSPGSDSPIQIERQFIDLPQILAVYLNIFTLDSESKRVVKNFHFLEISDTLRLVDSHYEDTHVPKIYELCAIIAHNGKSIDEGHYISVFMCEGRWIVADDTNIYGLSEDDIHGFLTRQVLPGYDSIVPYLLFYQKC